MAYLTHRDIWQARNTDAETSVYWAFGDAGELLYVGMARDVGERLSQHRREKPWWDDDVVIVRSLRFPDRAAALAAESRAIDDGQPARNINFPGERRAN